MITDKLHYIYKKYLSPLLSLLFPGAGCKFYPTCSEYSKLAIKKHGILKAIPLSLWRIIRCSPLTSGGIDYP
jgi:putative membrane protein insertion efficiency factor